MPKKRASSKGKRDDAAAEAPRPFFPKGTRDLETLLEQARSEANLELLDALAYELSFRDKPQSIALAKRVRDAIEEIKNPPPPESPLADVIRWLEEVAAAMPTEQAMALRESIKSRFPGFAEFLARREQETEPSPLAPQPSQPGLPFSPGRDTK